MSDELDQRLLNTSLADARRLSRLARKLSRRLCAGQPGDRLAARLESAVQRAQSRLAARLARRPEAPVRAELPIASAAEAIQAALATRQVVVVCGETGSGKTTQLPKICIAAGRGQRALIAHTQPRRVAARSIAARLIEELGPGGAEAVGYQVRFDTRVAPECTVKLLTDGILLAEVQSDPELLAYDTIIVDEAHERTLNIDFLLGHLKRLLAKRPELRVVVSSATIDAARFADFFDGAPVVSIEGRGHPVEVRYRPPAEGADLAEQVLGAVRELARDGPGGRLAGDVLVFLSGEREIREVGAALRRARLPGVELLELYARLPLARQQRIFKPARGRRVVLATNVAETSLTVPGIRYVVDSGTARIARYAHRSAVQRLPVEPISRASAEQRKGRCGRLGPGVCIRLYDEADFLARPEFAEPEIGRSDLAAVLLRLHALGMGDLEAFPFLDAPDRRHVNDGLRLLRELGALDEDDTLTPAGRSLARIPADPRIGRMLLAGHELQCLHEVLIIAAGLATADPRESAPAGGTAPVHLRFTDGRSDFMSMLRLWRFVDSRAASLEGGALHGFCRRFRLSAPRLREWQEVHEQLAQVAGEVGLDVRRAGGGYARIHRALLAGLLRNVGFLGETREYSGVRGTGFRLSPASALHASPPKWVLAAELVETHRTFAHRAASVRPEWVAEAAGGLLRRNHFEAYWDRRRGEVMVHEQVALYGLTVIPRRRVRLAAVSRDDARELFIRAALVEEQLDHLPSTLQRNHAVIERLRDLDHRLRRPDVMVSDRALFQFYDRRIPAGICDLAGFEGWRRGAEREDPGVIALDPQALGAGDLPESVAVRFPGSLRLAGARLPLHYCFAPGAPEDGVTVDLPLEMLHGLDPAPFERLVPGMLADKLAALLKLLPKRLRRELQPVQPLVDELATAPAVLAGERALARVLCEALRALRGVAIDPGLFGPERLAHLLEPHLLMRFRVLGEDGGVLGASRDLEALQRALPAPGAAPRAAGAPARAGAAACVDGVERQGLVGWDLGELPRRITRRRHGAELQRFPALADRATHVDVVLTDSEERAVEVGRAGLRRLLLLACGRQAVRRVRDLPAMQPVSLLYIVVPEPAAGHPDPGATGRAPGSADPHTGLAAELLDRAAERAFDADPLRVRDRAAFEAALAAGRARLEPECAEVVALVHEILEAFRALRALRRDPALHAPVETLDDIDTQLSHLVFRGFAAVTPREVLEAYPRYLGALQLRLEKLARGGARDGRKLALLRPLWERYLARRHAHHQRGRRDPELARYRWMLEEYRVSVFAQELGTAFPVSRKRLDEQWRRVAG